jgi:hypothetical protein
VDRLAAATNCNFAETDEEHHDEERAVSHLGGTSAASSRP